ncbi:hypothetical protein EDB87DRAFT_45284 [Lactarius vividus]|nr:hypothetical protein EDB87DRAFT_45284 [Lactarius vividus]
MFDMTIKTFGAARKYGMPSIPARFRTYCSRVACVVTAGDSFHAYGLASNDCLKEEALEAAQLTLSLPQTFETYGSSHCHASGPALLALWKHRGMVIQAIKRGVSLCLEEVGDPRDWKLDLPGDKDCHNVPAACLREQFVLFAEKIPWHFSTTKITNFVETMSSQVTECTSCTRQCPDNLCLIDCIERHVRGQIEKASPMSHFMQVVITINDGLSRCTTNYCHFSMN